MCLDPVSMAAVGITASQLSTAATVATIGSGLFGAFASIQQGNAQAKMAKRAAIMDDRAAEDARARGAEASADKRMEVSRFRARQAAQIAENGGDPTLGDGAALLRDTEYLGERDSFRIRRNAGREAQGLEQSALNQRASGANARTQGMINAGAGVLTTASTVASRWRPWQTTQFPPAPRP